MNHGANPRKTTRGERILIAVAYFICLSILVLGDGIVITKYINSSDPFLTRIWMFFFFMLLTATIFVSMLFISAWEDCYDDN
jgi:hypothetical protein